MKKKLFGHYRKVLASLALSFIFSFLLGSTVSAATCTYSNPSLLTTCRAITEQSDCEGHESGQCGWVSNENLIGKCEGDPDALAACITANVQCLGGSVVMCESLCSAACVFSDGGATGGNSISAAVIIANQVQANALGVLPIAAAVIGVIFGISLGIGLLLRWVRRHAK